MRASMKGALAALLLLLPGVAGAQAAPVEPIDDLQRLFIETTVSLIHPPDTATGQRVQALMAEAETARANRDNPAMRRLLSEARVLLAGGQWSPEAAFVASLALRPDRVAIDPARPVMVEIGQRFAAAMPGAGPVSVELGLRPRQAPGLAHEIVWRAKAVPLQAEFVDTPLRVAVPVAGLGDGSFDLVLRARQGDRLLGDTTLTVFIAAGLDRDLAEIDRRRAGLKLSEGQALPEGLAASLAYPRDLVETLDARSRQIRDVALRPLLDRTLALLTAAEQGQDPLAHARGSIERHYRNAAAGRVEPYRIYIPQRWDGRSRLPLVVVLHGSNGDHNRPFEVPAIAEQAEARGWAVLAPMGYAPNGGWGNHLPVMLANDTMPAPRPSTIAGVVLPRNGVTPEPAEVDVIETVARVAADYPIDRRRIYLMGNSMGGEGAWHLGALYPDLWAAVAAGAGAIAPADYPYARLGKLPVMGVHGDEDEFISHAATREMIDRLARSGGQGEMLSVPGGKHVAMNAVTGPVFDFFARHHRREDGQARRSE